jgi:hypothetical protein
MLNNGEKLLNYRIFKIKKAIAAKQTRQKDAATYTNRDEDATSPTSQLHPQTVSTRRL